jgi:hypothetical protein
MLLARTESDATIGGNDLERVPPGPGSWADDPESAAHSEADELTTQKTPLNGGPTPLPKQSMAALCAIRLVDPIAFTVIFPFINEMIESLDLTEDTSKIVFYSGIVVCIWRLSLTTQIYADYMRLLPGKCLCCSGALLDLPVGFSL